jgi:hypothetical protein
MAQLGHVSLLQLTSGLKQVVKSVLYLVPIMNSDGADGHVQKRRWLRSFQSKDNFAKGRWTPVPLEHPEEIEQLRHACLINMFSLASRNK